MACLMRCGMWEGGAGCVVAVDDAGVRVCVCVARQRQSERDPPKGRMGTMDDAVKRNGTGKTSKTSELTFAKNVITLQG
jgi:hypothetical protein